MTMITAHSGCDHTPDNSIEFVEYALKMEAECIEVDIRKQENKLILSHDETKEHVLELKNVFGVLRNYPKAKINCDLKEHDLEDEIFQLAKEMGVEKQLIYTGTVNLKKIKKENNQLQGVDVYLNIETISSAVSDASQKNIVDKEAIKQELFDFIQQSEKYELKGFNMNFAFYNEELVDCMKKFHLECSVWTVNETDEIKRFLKAKVANITTRNFAIAKQIQMESRIEE
ncbi:MAG: glycerophosphodiester phosphodiesterase [Lachnospiraceae bacterium]